MLLLIIFTFNEHFYLISKRIFIIQKYLIKNNKTVKITYIAERSKGKIDKFSCTKFNWNIRNGYD